MDYNDRQAIEGLFGKLSRVESQSARAIRKQKTSSVTASPTSPAPPISWRKRSLCRSRR